VLENALNAALKSAREFYEKCRQFYFDALFSSQLESTRIKRGTGFA
jgi:hypothetical protein